MTYHLGEVQQRLSDLEQSRKTQQRQRAAAIGNLADLKTALLDAIRNNAKDPLSADKNLVDIQHDDGSDKLRLSVVGTAYEFRVSAFGHVSFVRVLEQINDDDPENEIVKPYAEEIVGMLVDRNVRGTTVKFVMRSDADLRCVREIVDVVGWIINEEAEAASRITSRSLLADGTSLERDERT